MRPKREVEFYRALILAVTTWPGRWSQLAILAAFELAKECDAAGIPDLLDAIERRMRVVRREGEADM